ncbi:zinc finger protein [Macleaya cordata]|uniref:Zinc finger protein n=1 Tax=Macleaya cordata TaxID=56857 RepID=A0A200QCI7_MACCD|nr:zinc finger protein [Macleaya cordata]
MEEQRVFRYVSGLKPKIREALYLHTINNVTEAVALAQKMELQPKTITRNQSSYRSGSNYKAAAKITLEKPVANQITSQNSIGTKGVTIESSTPIELTNKKNNNPYVKPTGDKCWRCGQQGHLSNTCPRRRQTALVDNEQKVDEECDPKDRETPIDYTDGDEEEDGAVIFVKKVLFTPKQEDNTQQKQLFKI